MPAKLTGAERLDAALAAVEAETGRYRVWKIAADARDLDVRDEDPLEAHRARQIGGLVEHVAAADLERQVAHRLAAVRIPLEDVIEADHRAAVPRALNQALEVGRKLI